MYRVKHFLFLSFFSTIFLLSIKMALTDNGSGSGIKRREPGNVHRLRAGTGITLSPSSGLGDVEITGATTGALFTSTAAQAIADLSVSSNAQEANLAYLNRLSSNTPTFSVDYVPVKEVADSLSIHKGSSSVLNEINFVGFNTVFKSTGNRNVLTIFQNNLDAQVYDIVMATWMSLGTDCAFVTATEFDSCLATVAARGLSNSTTAQFKALIKDGLYNIEQATIPAGADIVFESSAVWRHAGTTDKPLAKVYGTVRGFNVDGASVAIKTALVQLFTGSRLYSPTLYNLNHDNTNSVSGVKQLLIGDRNGPMSNNIRAYDVVMKGDMFRIGSPNFYGENSNYSVMNSSDVVLNFKEFRNNCETNQEKASGLIYASSFTSISGKFYNMGNHALNISQDSANNTFELDVEIACNMDTNGLIDISNMTGVSRPAGFNNSIRNSVFTITNSLLSTGDIIGVTGTGGTNVTDNLTIENVEIRGTGTGSTVVGVAISNGGRGIQLLESNVNNVNTGLSESGIGTVKRNFKVNGAIQ